MSDFEPREGEQIDQEESILEWNEPGPTSGATGEHTAFWGDQHAIESVTIAVRPAPKPLAMLEKLGPSPFERGSFPLIGFLATTFDKVSQFALERAGYESPSNPTASSPDSPAD